MLNRKSMTPRIAVIGVGGAGGNAVNNMIAADLTDVQFIVANTDAQALAASSAEHRIQLGSELTEGLGAGARPEVGEAAAKEVIEDIGARIFGSHMVFIAAGMGGGTGTGAAPVIARVARDLGVLTVAVVTKPFHFEGRVRMRNAEAGIAELRKHVDTLLVIPNENLFRVADDRTTVSDAFVMADQVLYSGITCIIDLILKDGLIDLDFADVNTVLRGMGTAMMGAGEAVGDDRAVNAAEGAIYNPLIDDVSLKGAKRLLLAISGGRDLTLWDVDEAATRVRQEVDPDANIIIGAILDEDLGDKLRVSIVAAGMPRSVPDAGVDFETSAADQRTQSAPQPPAAGEPFGRRLVEVIGERDAQGKGRAGRKGRGGGARRVVGEASAKSDGSQKPLPQPGAPRMRKGSGGRKAAQGTSRGEKVAPPRAQSLASASGEPVPEVGGQWGADQLETRAHAGDLSDRRPPPEPSVAYPVAQRLADPSPDGGSQRAKLPRDTAASYGPDQTLPDAPYRANLQEVRALPRILQVPAASGGGRAEAGAPRLEALEDYKEPGTPANGNGPRDHGGVIVARDLNNHHLRPTPRDANLLRRLAGLVRARREA